MRAAMLIYFAMIHVAGAGATEPAQGGEFMPVCERSLEVRRHMEFVTGRDCSQIDQRELASWLGHLSIETSHPSLSLKCGDFSGLRNLKYLELRGISGGLQKCVFDGLSSLTTLEIQNSSIAFLPDDALSELSSLSRLILKRSEISSLHRAHFQSLRNLKDVDISGNQLTHLPEDLFADLRGLVYLNLSENPLTIVPPRLFYTLPNLLQIDLQFTSLQKIPDFAFVKQTKLMVLTVQNSPLRATSKAAFYGLGSGVVGGLADDFGVDLAGEDWRRE